MVVRKKKKIFNLNNDSKCFYTSSSNRNNEDVFSEIYSIHSQDYIDGSKQERIERVEENLENQEQLSKDIRDDLKSTQKELDNITQRKVARLSEREHQDFFALLNKGEEKIEKVKRAVSNRPGPSSASTSERSWSYAERADELSIKRGLVSLFKYNYTSQKEENNGHEQEANKAVEGFVKIFSDVETICLNCFELEKTSRKTNSNKLHRI